MSDIGDAAERWGEAPSAPVLVAGSGPKKAKKARQPAKPVYPDVVSFVNGYVATVTDTRVGGPVAWCPRWWEHPAAVVRLTALWVSWEVLRLRPDGMSAWFVGHYDPHMRALLDGDRGPFSRCHKAHQPASHLSVELPGPSWEPAGVAIETRKDNDDGTS